MATLPPHMSSDDLRALLDGNHADPFSVLGVHKIKGKSWLVAYVPDGALQSVA